MEVDGEYVHEKILTDLTIFASCRFGLKKHGLLIEVFPHLDVSTKHILSLHQQSELFQQGLGEGGSLTGTFSCGSELGLAVREEADSASAGCTILAELRAVLGRMHPALKNAVRKLAHIATLAGALQERSKKAAGCQRGQSVKGVSRTASPQAGEAAISYLAEVRACC